METYLQIDVAMTNKRACIVLYLQATIHLNPYQPTIKTFNIASTVYTGCGSIGLKLQKELALTRISWLQFTSKGSDPKDM